MHSSSASGVLFRSLMLALVVAAACWTSTSEDWADWGGAPYLRALLIAGFVLCAYALGRHTIVCRPDDAKAEVPSQHRIADQRESQYESLLDSCPDSIARYDGAGRITYANRRLEKLLDIPADRILGQTPTEVFPDKNGGKQIERLLARVLATGEGAEAELAFPDCASSLLHEQLLFVAERDAAGNIVGALSIGRDITKYKRLEKSLESCRQRHDDAQRIAHLGSWELDLATRHLHWSDEIFRIFELDPELSMPSHGTFVAVAHPDDRARVKQAYADAVHHLAPYDMEHRLLMSDGKIKYIHQRGATIYAKDGTPLRSIGTIQDVSAAREAARQLEESSMRLQELAAHREEVREEERRRIARELHEDLGQLLTSLRMGLSLLRVEFGAQTTALVEKLPPLLALADQSIEGLRHAVADLRPTPLDMGIVPALEWLVRVFSNHSGVECSLHCTNGIDLPDDKATAFFRVAQEALTNIARHADADHAEVVLEIADGELELRVKDDGRGFDPLASRHKSFGLGGIWERSLMLHGKLDIRSAVGKGTEIVLRCSL